MVTWRAVGAGIVELVETPPKLDRRHRKMGTLWWRTLGMAYSNRLGTVQRRAWNGDITHPFLAHRRQGLE